MNTIPAVFCFNSSYDVRAIQINNEPWFVAADVCAALTIANSRDGLARLDDDEKGVGSIDTLGGQQDMAVVNESGLYSLIMGSRKPEARKFKKWVTSEVLPAIRKTGSYSVQNIQPVLLTGKTPLDLFFSALRIYTAHETCERGPLWIELGEEMFCELGINELTDITYDNLEQCVSFIAERAPTHRRTLAYSLSAQKSLRLN